MGNFNNKGGLVKIPDLFENIPAIPQEYSVSEISTLIKNKLEDGFGRLRIRGEVSNFSRHGSGHIYFDLKDNMAVLNVVCWRPVASKLPFGIGDGLQLVITGKITSYPGRSRYQLVTETVELAGQGELLQLLLERKEKLLAEGLFDRERKKKLPFLPAVIGLITSPTGSVLQDILHRLQDRMPTPVLLWPVAVQGAMAAGQISKALEGFNHLPPSLWPKPDVIIVARGGGSLEDLWPFNEEEVVRAVAASKIPIISAVGHETDTTLIDFVADRRASTPSAAAEMVVPVKADLLKQLQETQSHLDLLFQQKMESRLSLVEGLARMFRRPQSLYEPSLQRFDELSERFERSMQQILQTKTGCLANFTEILRYNQQRYLSLHLFHQQVVGRFQQAVKSYQEQQAQRLHSVFKGMGPVSWRFNRHRDSITILTGQLQTNWLKNKEFLNRHFVALGNRVVSPAQQVKIWDQKLGGQYQILQQLTKQQLRYSQENWQRSAEWLVIKRLQQQLAIAKTKADNLAENLEGLSVTRLLKRGFLLAYAGDEEIIARVEQLKVGDRINLRFHDGLAVAQIEKKVEN